MGDPCARWATFIFYQHQLAFKLSGYLLSATRAIRKVCQIGPVAEMSPIQHTFSMTKVCQSEAFVYMLHFRTHLTDKSVPCLLA